jgi:Cache domain
MQIKSTVVYMEIANNCDIEKRKIADDILKLSDNFEAITFLLPNGDMYMEEPYHRQLDLSKNNFAFRDYYKGALETKAAFLGEVIISAATGERVAVISVPIYLEKDQSLVGIWNGVLNLGIFNKMLQSLNLSDGTRMIYVDGNGQKIADSNTLLSDKAESFVNLNSFKYGISGKNGNSTEVINGTKFLITYSPVEILSNTWIVMLMQPR